MDHDERILHVNIARLAQPNYISMHEHSATGPPDRQGIRTTCKLDTRPQLGSVWRAIHKGVVLYEPFGGLCAGLESLLRNNIHVHRYLYSDTCPAARNVARFRVHNLQKQYPDLLPMSAIEDSFSSLPHDVTQITASSLISAGALSDIQWWIIVGPECKDFSPAGHSRGLNGVYSHTLQACIQIIGTLQQLQTRLPPLFMVENAAMQHNFRSKEIRDIVFPAVCDILGTPITIDAVRFGSYAHRCRNFWQNLAPIDTLTTLIKSIHCNKSKPVDNILDAGRTSAAVDRNDSCPFYPANRKGQIRVALPTLVAYPMSRAFKTYDSPGAIYDSNTGSCI